MSLPHSPVAFQRWMVWFWPALVTTFILDLLTKTWIFSLPGRGLPAWIEQHYNTGVAWSMLAEHPGLVAGLTVVLIPLLAWVWWRGYRQLGALENLAFGLILGGALGNGWDRLLAVLGHHPGVRDFIHVDLNHIGINYIWPTFNIADSGITAGFILLLIRACTPSPKPAPSAS